MSGSEGLFEALQRAGLWLGLASIALAARSPARRARGSPRSPRTCSRSRVAVRALASRAATSPPTRPTARCGRCRGSRCSASRRRWRGTRCASAARAPGSRGSSSSSRRGPGRAACATCSARCSATPRCRSPTRSPTGAASTPRGRPVAPAAGQAVTALRDAELFHRPGLLADPAVVAAVAESAGLALRSERLQAELRARLEELRAIRGRIVAAGDAERRALERDLHDGAQQRLATLAVALEVARRRADGERAATLAEAQAEVRAALAALREVAHGLVPPVLADEGLGAGGRGVRGDRRRPRPDRRAADRRALRARGRGDRLPRADRGGAARAATPPSAPRARTAGCACRSTPPCRRERS